MRRGTRGHVSSTSRESDGSTMTGNRFLFPSTRRNKPCERMGTALCTGSIPSIWCGERCEILEIYGRGHIAQSCWEILEVMGPWLCRGVVRGGGLADVCAGRLGVNGLYTYTILAQEWYREGTCKYMCVVP